MTKENTTRSKLQEAVRAAKAKQAADNPPKTGKARAVAPTSLKEVGAERMAKTEREKRYGTKAEAAAAPPVNNMHDPEVAPHLFKKWVGDRVALVQVRNCDNPNCGARGEFRAPKSRYSLNSFYWFCLQHVQIYNAAWDYYQGMSVQQIDEAMRDSSTWERPTWPMGDRKIERSVRAAFKRVFNDDNIEDNAEAIHAKAQERGVDPRYAAQIHAMRELGLAPPIDFDGIKKRYRDLVKQYHPDVQGGSAEAEEKIKRLNSAFTILKLFYSVEDNSVEKEPEFY